MRRENEHGREPAPTPRTPRPAARGPRGRRGRVASLLRARLGGAGAPGPPPVGPSSPWRTRLTLAAGAIAVALLTLVAVRMSRPSARRPVVMGGPASARRPPTAEGTAIHLERPPEVESHIFQVAEATGRVEAHRGGRWVLISRGDVLTQDDVVRTSNGRALLKIGLGTEIELRDRVEVRLDSISRAGASLDLRRGKLVARVGRADSNLIVTAANTRTVNDRSAPARFVVLADDHGQVTVAATEGAARFESAGHVVVVPAGQITRAEAGQAPADPETIAEEIFLTVTWPTKESRDDDRIPIGGRVDPRSLVRVNGVPAEPDANGRFAAAVPVHDGSNPVEVEVEEISGRIRVERGEVRKIPTRPPELEPVKTELWTR
jgi:hypothetical protein